MKKFITRLTQWEYWPFAVLYFPIFFYYVWLILKHRSLFFFTASNPGIEFGGMLGEKKSDIFNIIPEKYIPKTRLVSKGDVESAIKSAMEIGFPVIAKPNVGERGRWVCKINSEVDLMQYAGRCPVDFLLQAMVSFPIELGVFFVKLPGSEGAVTSIVRKGFLSVTGDGNSTVRKLLNHHMRAQLQANLQSEYIKSIENHIPEKGENVLIEPIGNHSRGTTFLNDNHEIDAALHKAFQQLSAQIPGFHFGRFDLKCTSYAELKQLKNFQIMELNGAGAEPAHIYQPGSSLLRAYRDIIWHLSALSKISRNNHRNGQPYWSFRSGIRKWKAHQKHNKLLLGL